MPVFPSYFRKGSSPAESTARWWSSIRSMLGRSHVSSNVSSQATAVDSRYDGDATLTQKSVGSRPSAFDSIYRQKTKGSTYLALDDQELWRKEIGLDGYGLREDGTALTRDGRRVRGDIV